MLFSYCCGRQQIYGNKKMQVNHWQFWLPWRCSGTTRGASPDGAHPGLPSKPRDASIGQVPASYCPDGHHGRWIQKWNTQNTNKAQLLASHYGTFRFRSLVNCENFNPKTYPLLSSLMRQASCKCEMPRFELKSSRKFSSYQTLSADKIWKSC